MKTTYGEVHNYFRQVWDGGVWDFGRFSGGVFEDFEGNFWWVYNCIGNTPMEIRRWRAPADKAQWTTKNFQAVAQGAMP